MAYQIIQSNTVITKPNTAYGIDISYDHINGYKSIYSAAEQARVNLKNLILTSPGERFYHPMYGCGLMQILFQPNVNELKLDINTLIMDAITNWLPYLQVSSIDIKTTDDDPNLEYLVEISISVTFESIELQPVIVFINENGILTLK